MAGRMIRLGRLGKIFVKPRQHGLQATVPCECKQWRGIQTSFQAFGDAMKIKMPALSPTMQEGTIIKWYKQEGDAVSPGELLCDIQTDKAVVSLEVEDEGTLAKILKPDDSKNVAVGTLIALIAEEGDDWKSVEVPDDAEETPRGEVPLVGQDVKPSPSTSRLGYGPAVRTLLDIYQLDVADVPATGPHGRVLKGDLLTYIKVNGLKPIPIKREAATESISLAPSQPVSPPIPTSHAPLPPRPLTLVPAPAPNESEAYQDVEITNMRKIIAKRLTESKSTIPHAYSSIDCNIGQLVKLRKELKEDGIKVSMNDFIVKASAVALQQVPEVNALWTGEDIQLQSAIDICVAVATPSGLITPIVKNANNIGVQEISSTIKELATRAREGKLKPDEFMGGSFTISNLGMFGITHFSAVINPPQACIMAVGTSRVLPGEGPGDDPRTSMTVTLSSDSRVVDDALAARFLQVFRDTMENPMLMITQAGPKSSFRLREDDEIVNIDKEKLFAK